MVDAEGVMSMVLADRAGGVLPLQLPAAVMAMPPPAVEPAWAS